MSDPIIIADGYSAEPYGDAYIISHRDGGRRFAELDMAAAVREIARLRAAVVSTEGEWVGHKELARMRAALAAQVPQWMPIESAPKDGSAVLVWPPTWSGGAVTAQWCPDQYAKKPRPYWRRSDDLGRAAISREKPPSHWMPTPAGPGASSPPAGMALVPVEPTEAMHVAAVRTIVHCTGNDDFPPRVWRAMLAASPQESATTRGRG